MVQSKTSTVRTKTEETSDRYWTPFYTKSRNEKKVAERLLELGHEVYCPQTETIKIWSDRKKKVKEPLFKSYVFVRVNEQDRMTVLQDPGIVFNLQWLGKPALIRDEEIEAIQRFLKENPSAKSVGETLEKGQVVKVKSGVLQGNLGIVKEVRRGKVLLTLQRIGFVLQAEIDGDLIE
ncbi:MAG: antitermination protein NusG [Crocinitomicaceae bacterium]|nr:antitermination protein NusG [Crocinitomicaceae bacterium]